MTNHPIRRCHCLELYQRAGEVDGLDMAVSVKVWPPSVGAGACLLQATLSRINPIRPEYFHQ